MVLMGTFLRLPSPVGEGVIVADTTPVSKRPADRLVRWLLEDVVEDVPGPEAKEGRSEQHPWWQVVLNGCVGPWLTWTTLAPSDDGPPSMALGPADEAGNRPRSPISTETYE